VLFPVFIEFAKKSIDIPFHNCVLSFNLYTMQKPVCFVSLFYLQLNFFRFLSILFEAIKAVDKKN